MDNILNKIKKLLDKAQLTDNIKEKETFMAKAQSMLQQHNIEISDVTALEEKEKEITEKRLPFDQSWERDLINIICKNNFCENIKLGYGKTVAVIGKTHNIDICMYMYVFF